MRLDLEQIDRVFTYVVLYFQRRIEPARVFLGMRLPDYLDADEFPLPVCPRLVAGLFCLYRELGEDVSISLADVERLLAGSLSKAEQAAALYLMRLEMQRLLPILAEESDRDAVHLTELGPDATKEQQEMRMAIQRIAGREELAQSAESRLESKYLNRIAAGVQTPAELTRRLNSLAWQAKLKRLGITLEEQGEQVLDWPKLMVEALQERESWQEDGTFGDCLNRALKAAKGKLQYHSAKAAQVLPESQQQIDIEIEQELATEEASPEERITALLDTEEHWEVLAKRASSLPRQDQRRNALAILQCLRADPTRTQDQVAKLLKLSRKTVNKCLKDLKMR